MNELDKKLNKICNDNDLFEHGLIAEHVKALFTEEMEKIIGEDEEEPDYKNRWEDETEWPEECRNYLRSEQRQKLSKLMEGE